MEDGSRSHVATGWAVMPTLILLALMVQVVPSSVAQPKVRHTSSVGELTNRPTQVRTLGMPAAQRATPTTEPESSATPTAWPTVTDVDIVAVEVDAAGLSFDPQHLAVSGVVTALLHASGEFETPFTVRFFEDLDGDGAWSTADNELGEVLVAAPSVSQQPGASPWSTPTGDGDHAEAVITTTLSGTVEFRGQRVFVAADVEAAIAESDEGNNVAHSAARCRATRPTGDLAGEMAPRLIWRWPPETGPAQFPGSDQVEMTPLVIDLDGDGKPEVLFVTRDRRFDVGGLAAGRLRVISGDDGTDVWTVADDAKLLNPFVSPAAADLDGDGRVEIVALGRDRRTVHAMRFDGGDFWSTELPESTPEEPGVSIADLDGDGAAEVLVGGYVLEGTDGRIRFGGAPGAVAADLDMDMLVAAVERGGLEVSSGARLFNASGELLRVAGTLSASSYNQAIADLDGDGRPEIIDVASAPAGRQGGGYLRVVDALTGVSRWEAPFPVRPLPGAERSRGGPPVIADFDGDGLPEIGVAGRERFAVFDFVDRTVATFNIDDSNSGVTGAAAFDFDGDGRFEIVYSDMRTVYLLTWMGNGLRAVWTERSPSTTLHEMPVVADVTGNGIADLLVPTGEDNDTRLSGLRLYSNPGWSRARPIWNQHAFHGSHVDDRGGVPRWPRPHWLSHNTFRANPGPDGGVAGLPALSISRIVVKPHGDGDLYHVEARLGNGGVAQAGQGIPVAFYVDGAAEPAAVVAVSERLPPGTWQPVSATLALSSGLRHLRVAVNDPAAGPPAAECPAADGANDDAHEVWFTVAGGPTPTVETEPAPGPTATPTGEGEGPLPRPESARLILPIALVDSCNARGPRDIVLLIDASGSMLAPVGERSALAWAKQTALLLLQGLSLGDAGGADRVAVLAFHDAIEGSPMLTGDRAALVRDIESIAAGRYSRMDLGLRAAEQLLLGTTAQRAGRAAVIILGDGRPSPIGRAPVRSAADTLRAEGVALYAVGVGPDADVLFLAELTGARRAVRGVHAGTDPATIAGRIGALMECLGQNRWPAADPDASGRSAMPSLEAAAGPP